MVEIAQLSPLGLNVGDLVPLTHRDLIFLAAKIHGGSWGGGLSGSTGYKLIGYESLLQSCPMLISLDVSVFRINCVSADTGSHRSCVCVPPHLHVNGVLRGFSLIFNNRKDWLIEICLKRVYLPLGLGTIDYDSSGKLQSSC